MKEYAIITYALLDKQHSFNKVIHTLHYLV